MASIYRCIDAVENAVVQHGKQTSCTGDTVLFSLRFDEVFSECNSCVPKGIEEVISSSMISRSPRVRSLSLRWSLLIYKWAPVTVEIAVMLAGMYAV